jgi:hypothetical protein
MSDSTVEKQDGDPRRRLRELLAVPERERTDKQWDEIIALEIRLAPGNQIEPARRADAPSSSISVHQPSKRRVPSPRTSGKRPRKSGR